MKKIKIKKSFWQSLLSFAALAVFAYFAFGSFGASQQKRYLGDGVYEIAKYYGNGNTEIIQGTVDDHGNWHGATTLTHEDEDGIMISKEEVNMVNGLRNGVSTTTFSSGRVYTICYEMGERVDCEKAAAINAEYSSAFDFYSYKYPWVQFTLNAFGFTDDYIESYLDTVETLLYATEFDAADFDDYYDSVIDVLEDTPYDSIISANAELTIHYGLELIQKSEFRMAVIDANRAQEPNTFNTVKSKYPNYLLTLVGYNVNEPDFEVFCHQFDSIMASYDMLDIEDPFFIDSIDTRMYATMQYIANPDDDLIAESLIQAISVRSINKSDIIKNKLTSILKSLRTYSNPQEVAEVVLSLIYSEFLNADLFRLSVKEVWLQKNGVILLPKVTTEFIEGSSSTGAVMKGFVSDNGGDEITSRGIAWAEFYNPTIEDNSKASGTGVGEFSVVLDNLSSETVYFARAFATNSAGISYGNCVSFTLTGASVIDNDLLDNNLKIYPNPTAGNVTLSFNSNTSTSAVLTVTDLAGRLVYEFKRNNCVVGRNEINLDVSGFENGVYIFRLESGGKEVSARLLIAK